MTGRRGVGRVFEAALSGAATDYAAANVERETEEAEAEDSSDRPAPLLWRGVKYGAITGSLAAVGTNLALAVGVFIYELFIGDDADGPFQLLAIVAVRGSIIAFILGTIIGAILGLLYTTLRIHPFAKWTTPALQVFAIAVFLYYNRQFNFLGHISISNVHRILLYEIRQILTVGAGLFFAYSAGNRFSMAVRDGTIRRSKSG